VEPWLTILPLLASVLVGGLAKLVQDRIAPRKKVADTSLEQRLSELGLTMKQAAGLLTQVEAELEARAVRARTLQAAADEAENLAKLHAQEREAVARLVRGEIAMEGKRSARQQLVANLLFFLAGVLVSVAVNLFVQPLRGG
jgi:hypothetical protein